MCRTFNNHCMLRYQPISQTWSFRGSKSRNKVSVSEPAEGSLEYYFFFCHYNAYKL